MLASCSIALLTAFPVIAGGGMFARALGLAGTPGDFVVDNCKSRSGRSGANWTCRGQFVPDESSTHPVNTWIGDGPHPQGTRIPVRYGEGDIITGSGITRTEPAVAAEGYAWAAIFGALGLFMAAGFVILLIPRHSVLRACRSAAWISAAIGATGVAAALIAAGLG